MKQYWKWKLVWMTVIVWSMAVGLQAQEKSVPGEKLYEQRVDAAVQASLLQDYKLIEPYFREAYMQYPQLPRGVLEAVSFTYARFQSLTPSDTLELDETAMPRAYGAMGLTLHGKGVFRENLRLVSQLSGYAVEEIVSDSRVAILAYAAAFSRLQASYGLTGDDVGRMLPVLVALSELPIGELNPFDVRKGGPARWDVRAHPELYPMLSSLYAMLLFLDDEQNACFGAPGRKIDFAKILGKNLRWLQSGGLSLPAKSIKSRASMESIDYPQAIWCPAAACNYSQGRTQTITNVVIHYTEGTYAGSIAWFQNCNARASAHYVIRSIDGQVTQMVAEADKAWHVGNSNGYTIGIEHEAYGNIYSYFTSAMYASSAELVRDICVRRPNISPLRTFYRDTLDDGTVLNSGLHSLGGATACVHIRGHQHFSSQTHTDPGPFWNWNYYYKLLNPDTPVDVLSAQTGAFYDSGGPAANYGNDERQLTLIHVPGADSIVMEFSSFDLEPNYDFMWIYDGNTPFAPKIGRWNTRNPGRVVAHGESMLVEFRSDCATTRSGWEAVWHAFSPTPSVMDAEPPTTDIGWDENQWITQDVTIAFQDTDNVALRHRFYQVVENVDGCWRGNVTKGFLYDSFEGTLSPEIWSHDGHWQVAGNALRQTSSSMQASSIVASVNQSTSDAFLYEFILAIDGGDSCAFFFGANGQNVNAQNFRGYKLVLNRNAHAVSLYKCLQNGSVLLQRKTDVNIAIGQAYHYRVVWDRMDDSIMVFRQATQLLNVGNGGAVLTSSTQKLGFATWHAAITVDNVCSYVSRSNVVLLTVGEGNANHLRAQAAAGAPRCKLRSVVLDESGLFSTSVERSLKVDYTPPRSVVFHDRVDPRNAMQFPNGVYAEWNPSVDAHSGIKDYHYLVEIRDVAYPYKLVWTSVGMQTFCVAPIRLNVPFTARLCVRAENNAGLLSAISYSPFERYDFSMFRIRSLQGVASDLTAEFYNLSGRLVQTRRLGADGSVPMEGLSPGLYLLRVVSGGETIYVGKVVKP